MNGQARANMAVVAQRTRAYFAPVDRVSGTPKVFDPTKDADFLPSTTPPGWLDLGWVEGLKRTPGTHVEALRAGARGAVVAQVRCGLDARVECEFREWGKLQMALAGGGQHLNVLSGDSVAAQAGSTAVELKLDASGFAAGDLVAVDVDYSGETGYIGSGIAGAYVTDASKVGSDRDYVRRVTFNVARAASVNADALELEQPLPGGAPLAAARVQKVTAFLDREGGNFFQEWSALFVVEGEAGGRVCFYYPRLQAAAPAQENRVELQAPLEMTALRANLVALPYRDPIDGEQAVCWRVYWPATGAAAW